MRGSPFFESVHQTELEIGGEVGRTPTFYHDGAYMQALFAARLPELRKLMPDPRYVPARLAPGLGVIAITCLEYRDTDIGPYNELAIAVPLNEPWFRANLPARALAESLRRRQTYAFVLHLPVTTDVALRGGVDLYNFPKFIGEIEFGEGSGMWTCRLAEGKEEILSLTGAQLPTLPGGREDLFCRLWMDGQPQMAQFAVNRLALGQSARGRHVSLGLGAQHPIALELGRLIASRRALRYEYVPRMEGILFGPEHFTLPLVRRSLRAIEAVERHPVIS